MRKNLSSNCDQHFTKDIVGKYNVQTPLKFHDGYFNTTAVWLLLYSTGRIILVVTP